MILGTGVQPIAFARRTGVVSPRAQGVTVPGGTENVWGYFRADYGLWQDVDGTIPADEHGDLIARWDAVYPEGVMMTQATENRRPTLSLTAFDKPSVFFDRQFLTTDNSYVADRQDCGFAWQGNVSPDRQDAVTRWGPAVMLSLYTTAPAEYGITLDVPIGLVNPPANLGQGPRFLTTGAGMFNDNGTTLTGARSNFVGVASGASNMICRTNGTNETYVARDADVIQGAGPGADAGGGIGYFLGNTTQLILYTADPTASRLATVESEMPVWTYEQLYPLDRWLIIFDGDSLTAGSSTWQKAFMASLSEDAFAINISVVAASLINHINPHRPYWVDPYGQARTGGNLVFIWAGTNDLNNSTSAADVYAELQDYGTAAKAAGFTVIMFDCIARGTFSGGQQTAWQSVLDSLAADFPVEEADGIYSGGDYADLLIRLTTDAAFYPHSASANTTYYDVDTIHLNATGNDLVTTYAVAAAALIGLT
jgi:hypothetical protein